MKFPFDELNMCDREHVEWVKSQRDPELWHAAAIAIVNTVGDPCAFLVWPADQPELDRATAGYVSWHTDPAISAGRRIFPAAKECPICRRAATSGFVNDSLGLHPGFEAPRHACLDLINRGQVADGIAIPHAILDAPFPSEQRRRYFVEGGAVLDFNPGPFLAPKNCPRCQRTGWVCTIHRNKPMRHALPDGSACRGAAAPCEEPDCPYCTHPTDTEFAADDSAE